MFNVLLSVLAAVLFLTPPPSAFAAKGDCGQPSSTGDQVRSSDALAVLKAAVAIEDCGLCVCDVDGSGAIRASDALTTLKAAVGIPDVELTCDLCRGPGVSGRVLGIGGTLDDADIKRGDDPVDPFGNFTVVPGALVELHEIDTFGESLGLLDVTVADEFGRFSFRASTGLGVTLELRAFNTLGDLVLSAFVTASETDIDPATQFVVSTVLDRGVKRERRGQVPPLTNFTPGEYNGCVAQARSVTPQDAPADARAFVELIGLATGGVLADQIRSFVASTDLTDLLDGDYWAISSDFFFQTQQSLGLIDESPDLNGRCTFIGAGTNEVNFDGSGGFATGDCLLESFGLCETSGTQRFSGMADQKVNATVELFAEGETCEAAVGGTYDIAADGTVLAVDPEGQFLPMVSSPDGAYLGVGVLENGVNNFARGYAIGFPQSKSASEATFSGEYHIIDTENILRREPFDGAISRTVGIFSGPGNAKADGSGSVDITFGNGSQADLTEVAPPADQPGADPKVTVSIQDNGDEEVETLEYSIKSNGFVEFLEGEGAIATGAISPDGVLLGVNSPFDDDTERGIGTLFFVREAEDMSSAQLAGTYTLVGQIVEFEEEFEEGDFNGNFDSNFRSTCVVNALGSLNLGGDKSFGIPTLVIDEVCLDEQSFVERSDSHPEGRPLDAAVSFFTITETDDSLAGSWSVDPDGSLAVDLGFAEFAGAASPDGSFILLHGIFRIEEFGSATRVVLLGIRQSSIF